MSGPSSSCRCLPCCPHDRSSQPRCGESLGWQGYGRVYLESPWPFGLKQILQILRYGAEYAGKILAQPSKPTDVSSGPRRKTQVFAKATVVPKILQPKETQMTFDPKNAVNAARDIATNFVEKASDIVENVSDIIKGDIAGGANDIVQNSIDIATHAVDKAKEIFIGKGEYDELE
ncbi:hypothetical protein JK2ML_2022 [Mycobacterium leprae Kyoto-2]|uniref:Uncharacterized protein n=4 Tax=Mycobacterium leprae TaxID=1769 RepID=Q9CBF9_MYCLE|nr:hypothetical protein DIJ64_11060 [Mycobacterium leprae]BBC17521.1 hypothetical protein JK2ML_2022 [Mycobacterium leprae Kyoto-2]CAC30977.1 conserved hypothetical protein [Mycobacterium leprae]CAR72119.1 conserved hypothetical protein [Mycobacterium leprae Br4923]